MGLLLLAKAYSSAVIPVEHVVVPFSALASADAASSRSRLRAAAACATIEQCYASEPPRYVPLIQRVWDRCRALDSGVSERAETALAERPTV